MARTPASGIQHTIRAGEYEAVIASVGATLRSLTYAGRDLVVPFGADEVRPAHRGATLAPWPNRSGTAITAIGLQLAMPRLWPLCWSSWQPITRRPSP